MGSFNHTGNFSNLPIRYGDRIVVMVGFARTSTKEDIDNFSPGHSFTPLSLPIRGEFDDYGGIMNVDASPCTEQLEKVLESKSEEIVRWAERISCGCEDQLRKTDLEKIKNLIDKNFVMHSSDEKKCIRFGYIMEHESIFDYLVAMNNFALKDKHFWRIPHYMIESLGYKKNKIGTENSYEIIEWKHDTLPTLKEKCYVWLESEYNDYLKISNSFAILCQKIGCEVPEQYSKNYFESCFEKSIAQKEDFNTIPFFRDKEEYSFFRFADRGLFGISEYYSTMGLCGIFDTAKSEHLEEEYKKEFVELASFLGAMKILNLTWGNTHYYNQDIDYKNVIGFHKCILDTITNKYEKYKEIYGEEEE